MTRRTAALTAAALACALALTSCSPSPEQQACENAGGTWITETVGYYPLIIRTGKTTTTTVVPITKSRCVQPLEDK